MLKKEPRGNEQVKNITSEIKDTILSKMLDGININLKMAEEKVKK